MIQPRLAGLMDGSISSLAPLFAAAFATRDRQWIKTKVKKTSPGPMGVGTTYRIVRKFLGWRIEEETDSDL